MDTGTRPSAQAHKWEAGSVTKKNSWVRCRCFPWHPLNNLDAIGKKATRRSDVWTTDMRVRRYNPAGNHPKTSKRNCKQGRKKTRHTITKWPKLIQAEVINKQPDSWIYGKMMDSCSLWHLITLITLQVTIWIEPIKSTNTDLHEESNINDHDFNINLL